MKLTGERLMQVTYHVAFSNKFLVSVGGDKLPTSVFYLPSFYCPDNAYVDISFCVCWLRSVLARVSPVTREPRPSEEQWLTMVMRFYLWLFPLASLACHAKPQHPGNRDNCCPLPSGQS